MADMIEGVPDWPLTPEELDRLIRHLRKSAQSFKQRMGGDVLVRKTDDCLAADYLEALRSELPHWQAPKDEPEP